MLLPRASVGARVTAVAESRATVTVNGDIQAGAHEGMAGSGVFAEANTGSTTKVVVNGNVSAIERGIGVCSQHFGGVAGINLTAEVGDTPGPTPTPTPTKVAAPAGKGNFAGSKSATFTVNKAKTYAVRVTVK